MSRTTNPTNRADAPRRRERGATRAHQLPLEFHQHGGRRKGAGRKLAPGKRRSVPHKTRAPLNHVHPVHITLRICLDAGNLRTKVRYRAIRAALELGKERFGFRVIQYSVQRNHIHIIGEAAHRVSLSRGIQGLNIRIARRVNRAIVRAGRVLADRYHARALTTPRETRAALAYVLQQARRHREWLGAVPRDLTDYEFSSAPWFDGWSIRIPWQREDWPDARLLGATTGPPDSLAPSAVGEPTAPVCAARTWLLAKGWRRRGLIDPAETPGLPPAWQS